MPVEIATTIKKLDATWPLRGDPFNEHQSHLRKLKKLLKDTFPGAGGDGFVTPVTASISELNYCEGLTANVQDTIDGAKNNLPSIGDIISYAGTVANIPSSYQQCDGTNGTPNLEDRFIRGTNTQTEIMQVGGSKDKIVPAHTHNINHGHTNAVTNGGDHTHLFNGSTGGSASLQVARIRATAGLGVVTQTTSDGVHDHPVTIDNAVVTTGASGESGIDKNLPVFYTLMYLQRIT